MRRKPPGLIAAWRLNLDDRRRRVPEDLAREWSRKMRVRSITRRPASGPEPGFLLPPLTVPSAHIELLASVSHYTPVAHIFRMLSCWSPESYSTGEISIIILTNDRRFSLIHLTTVRSSNGGRSFKRKSQRCGEV